MRTFLLSLAGAFVAMMLFFILGFFMLFGLIASIASAKPPHPASIVLTLDLNESFVDQAPTSGLAAFSGTPGFIDLLTKLKDAETDSSVKGLYIRGGSWAVGTSRSEELRQAIQSFRDSGKFVVAHSQGMFSSSGPSLYHSISAADEIWMQPGTEFIINGVTFEAEFYKGLFDMIGLTPEIYAFYEYKNAPNAYSETSLTEPHREALQALADSIWSTALEAISEDREIALPALRALLERGPMTAEQAMEAGLVDSLGWPEEVEEATRERAGRNTEMIRLAQYNAPPERGRSRAPVIAVIGGQGMIVPGGGGSSSPFSSPPEFASDVIARAILDAADDDDVRAIVFRVDSPGGVPNAADQIWRAVERAKEKGKPVVVSMGSAAASGGYYVSMGANAILANEGTITGSIGIFGGKFAIEGTLNKIGISFDTVTTGGEYASAWGVSEFTDAQERDVRAILKRGYDRFVTLAAEGRGKTFEEMDRLARGRVWTGRDAVGIGLIDATGTFMDAVEKAKELGGIDPDVKPRLAFYPVRKSGFEALENLFGVSAEAARAAALVGAIAGDRRTEALLEQLAVAEAVNSGQTIAVGPRLRER
ncbi:signal peptide peptidase SppA [Hyphomonas sp.]|uniref:signal peptide peptidase SppA n=1 Tax=Hyphomonas sp. TaxID=87 RepID=UPI003918F4A7